ncbi:MAG: Ig domain-containing protein [Syntrophomonas sp.]
MQKAHKAESKNMMKRQLLKSNYISWFLIGCGVLFFWLTLSDSQSMAQTWNSKEAKYNKVWTIEFNSDVDASSVDSDTVYVLDSNEQKISYISPQVESNKILLSLNNEHTYAEGSYKLVISSDVSSAGGVNLAENLIMPFEVLGSKYYKFDDSTLPSALTGKNYTVNLGGTRDDGYRWEIVSNSLPAGLTLDTVTGTISGQTTGDSKVYQVIVKKTKNQIAEQKSFDMTVLPGNYLSYEVAAPVYTPGEQLQPSEATLTYDNGIKKSIEVLWDNPASSNLGSQNFTGCLGGTDCPVTSSGNVSYLKAVNFKYDYWATIQWRTVTATVNGAVREVWMDANYNDGARTRKMDLMKPLSDITEGNVFGTNTTSLKAGDQVSFRLFDAYGTLLETRPMVVD